jgi:hypothetical protein
MTGGAANGGAAVVLYAAAVGGVGIPGLILTGKAMARWRRYLPARVRASLGYPCEGDAVRCLDCGVTAVAEAVPDPLGADGYSLTCGACGFVLDYGEGMA